MSDDRDRDRAAEIKNALALMSPGPWEADVGADDPEAPYWTGKFRTGDRGAGGTSWCTYDDSDADTLPNVQGIALLVTEVPALVAEVEELRRRAHDAALAVVHHGETARLLDLALVEICRLEAEQRLTFLDSLERRDLDRATLRDAETERDFAAKERDAWKTAWGARLDHERRGDRQAALAYAAALASLKALGLCPHSPGASASECGTCTPCSCKTPRDVMYGGNRGVCSICHRDIPPPGGA